MVLKAPVLVGSWYDGPRGRPLYHSRFNPAWLKELGVVPEAIIDAGAYDGGDAFRFSAIWPRALVIAVEGDPDRCAAIRWHIGNSDVLLIEAALCEADGPRDWYPATMDGRIDAQGSLYRQTENQNRRAPRVRQNAAPITVRGCRLDSLCAEMGVERIDLLHMDIQGAEHAALVGLGDLRPKVIWLETTDDGWVGAPGKREIGGLLAAMGYDRLGDFGNDELHVHAAA